MNDFYLFWIAIALLLLTFYYLYYRARGGKAASLLNNKGMTGTKTLESIIYGIGYVAILFFTVCSIFVNLASIIGSGLADRNGNQVARVALFSIVALLLSFPLSSYLVKKITARENISTAREKGLLVLIRAILIALISVVEYMNFSALGFLG